MFLIYVLVVFLLLAGHALLICKLLQLVVEEETPFSSVPNITSLVFAKRIRWGWGRETKP